MEGEINNNPEMHQPEVPPPPAEWHRRPFGLLIIVAVVLIAIIVWIGNWSLNQGGGTPPARLPLTEAEKARILESLRQPSGTPPMTQAQKDEVLNSLRQPSPRPPLTEAEKQEILRSLE